MQAVQEQLEKVGINYAKPFNFSKADRQIAAMGDPARAPFTKRAIKANGKVNGKGSGGTYANYRKQREKWKAEEAEIKVRKMASELIEVEKVKQIVFEQSRQVRDAIQSIPDRLAGIVAAEMDQAKVHAILTKELHQALEGLTS